MCTSGTVCLPVSLRVALTQWARAADLLATEGEGAALQLLSKVSVAARPWPWRQRQPEGPAPLLTRPRRVAESLAPCAGHGVVAISGADDLPAAMIQCAAGCLARARALTPGPHAARPLPSYPAALPQRRAAAGQGRRLSAAAARIGRIGAILLSLRGAIRSPGLTPSHQTALVLGAELGEDAISTVIVEAGKDPDSLSTPEVVRAVRARTQHQRAPLLVLSLTVGRAASQGRAPAAATAFGTRCGRPSTGEWGAACLWFQRVGWERLTRPPPSPSPCGNAVPGGRHPPTDRRRRGHRGPLPLCLCCAAVRGRGKRRTRRRPSCTAASRDPTASPHPDCERLRGRAAAGAGVGASSLESDLADAAVRGGAVEFAPLRSTLVAIGGRPVLDALVGAPARLMAHRCADVWRGLQAGYPDIGAGTAAFWPAMRRAVDLLHDVAEEWRPLASLVPGAGEGGGRGSVVVRADRA